MSEINCDACADLRDHAANFITNGVTDVVAASLAENTGFNPNLDVLYNNCEDLNDANDCLIGMLKREIDSYDTCDWKEFMKAYLSNNYEMLKAIIASGCGQWCAIENLINPRSYTLHAYEDDDPNKPAINGFRVCQGVRVRMPNENSAPPQIIIHGNMARIVGSLAFDGNMPTSYTNGATVAWTDFWQGGTQVTNKDGYSTERGVAPIGGGFLIYEYQVRACDYGFDRLYPGHLFNALNGQAEFYVNSYRKGHTVPADWGNNSPYIYNPSDPNMMLIQVRLKAVTSWGKNADNSHSEWCSPTGYTAVRLCRSAWEC